MFENIELKINMIMMESYANDNDDERRSWLLSLYNYTIIVYL